MVVCFILVVITIADGFRVAGSPFFIAIEFILCLTVTVDLGLKVKMQGFKKYLKGGTWNKLDFFIVISCNLIIMLSIFKSENVAEPISEELLLIAWSVFQSLRMLMIARKQRAAIRSAKNLIDFTNIGLENENHG